MTECFLYEFPGTMKTFDNIEAQVSVGGRRERKFQVVSINFLSIRIV